MWLFDSIKKLHQWCTSRAEHDWSALELMKLIVAQVTIDVVFMLLILTLQLTI
jgi:hypothetical protein